MQAKKYVATMAVSDMDRAKSFYVDTLGFSVLSEDPAGAGLEVPGSGGQVLAIYPSAFAGSNQATAASFLVDDVEATVAELRAAGVTIEEYDIPGMVTENGITTIPTGAQVAWFKDPDGNIISVGNHDWAG